MEELNGMRKVFQGGILFLFFLVVCPPSLWATHAIDHRFKVSGYVKDQAGKPVVDGKVIVATVRKGEGSTTFTNQGGYYEVILHLHNEDVGDTVEITAGGQKKKVTASFDTSDRVTARGVQVDFDLGESNNTSGVPVWAYGIAAILLVGAALSFGFLKKRKSGSAGPSKKSSQKKS